MHHAGFSGGIFVLEHILPMYVENAATLVNIGWPFEKLRYILNFYQYTFVHYHRTK